jgi:AcrR family transcriptional regulator
MAEVTAGDVTRSARPPRRGRPRSQAADEAILAAALEVVAEVGYKVATLEMIAARAGVGTATIYRRYNTKSALVAAALEVSRQEFTAPHTGDVREDLARLMHQLSTGLRAGAVGRVLAAMSFMDPELVAVGWSALGQPRRAVLADVVADAITSGQLRQDLNTELFLDVLSAVPIWSELVRPGGEFSIESAHATIDLLLAGAAPAAASGGPEETREPVWPSQK